MVGLPCSPKRPSIPDISEMMPAKPELPKFDVEKLNALDMNARAEAYRKGARAGSREVYAAGPLAVANYAVEQALNPPKNPVEVLAEKIGALWLDFTNEADAASIVARHILETYPDAAERL